MISTLEPIRLDELVARAALLNRLDRKYIVSDGDLPSLVDGLPCDARVLEVAGQREFGYRSVYFDTPQLDCYLAAARRRRKRFKVRLRTYVDSGERFVEVKTRGPRGRTIKHRTPSDSAEGQLDPAAQEFVRTALANAGIAAATVHLRPVLTTFYRRSTLLLPATGTRVTVDTAIMWTDGSGTVLPLPGRAVVETKSFRSASEIDRFLWSIKHRPSVISKYATGLAALRPDLPSHRWRQVLRQHFPVTAEKRWP